jgi:hypothetical protein
VPRADGSTENLHCKFCLYGLPDKQRMDPLGQKLFESQAPKTTLDRVLPYWDEAIAPRLKAGEDFTTLAGATTQRAGMREKNGSLGTVSPRTSSAARAIEERSKERPVAEGSWIGPVKDERGWMFVKLERVVAPRQKTFEEALPELATAYQDALQQSLTATWLDRVRTRHPVTMNWTAIDAIWKPTARKKK